MTTKPTAPGIRDLVASYGGSSAIVAAAERADAAAMMAEHERRIAAIITRGAERLAAIVAKSSAEREPVAAWTRPTPQRWHLVLGHLRAVVFVGVRGVSWRVAAMFDGEYVLASSGEDDPIAGNVGPAQLAAEDALLALLRDAAGVLGYDVRKAWAGLRESTGRCAMGVDILGTKYYGRDMGNTESIYTAARNLTRARELYYFVKSDEVLAALIAAIKAYDRAVADQQRVAA